MTHRNHHSLLALVPLLVALLAVCLAAALATAEEGTPSVGAVSIPVERFGQAC